MNATEFLMKAIKDCTGNEIVEVLTALAKEDIETLIGLRLLIESIILKYKETTWQYAV
jgi:myosin-crossreactive antigen